MPTAQDDDRIVFIVCRDTQCEQCEEELGGGRFVCLTGNRALCLKCAGLDHLEFLPSGDTAITRRATKYSSQHVVVMKKSAARKRSERQGILAEPEAIRRAEEESAADADKRKDRQKREAKRREAADNSYMIEFSEAITRLYPDCPEATAAEIAFHACEKYSGRVGRSAAAKQFDETAIRLAVEAHVRHHHTDYDSILAECDDKQEARREVKGKILDVLAEWERRV